METIGERDNGLTAGIFTSYFQSRLNRVSTGWTSELNFVVHVAWLKDQVTESLKEGSLRIGMHIQTVSHAIRFDVINQSLFERRVVVTVVECACATQKIDVFVAIAVGHGSVLRLNKGHRE